MPLSSPIRLPLRLGLQAFAARRGGVSAFDPATLFASGELGVWLDPSDTTTLFRDINAQVPATAAGHDISFQFDKSLGLLLGPELVVNGGFSADTNWAKGTGWSIASGVASYSGSSQANRLTQGYSSVNNRAYLATYGFTMLATPNAFARMALNIGGGGQDVFILSQNTLSNGLSYTLSGVGFPTSVFSWEFRIHTNLNYQVDVTVDSVSVRQLFGWHARQASGTLMPLFQTAPNRVVFDGIDDAQAIVFPSSLGSNCTIARSIPGVGAEILTGQTVGSTYSLTQTHSGFVIVNRALTTPETAGLTAYLEGKAFF